ncbi:MAG: cobalamin-independent methionine synthase II family protein [Candidatus Poribacteria bacterium]|nr:cobalamin-independent methionine synthase II family protein [Candidatus Poribacteria bacterium]
MTTDELFPTTVIGSMPRPPVVKDLLNAHEAGNISEAEFRKRCDAAVQYVIALQEQAGIDIISDGEWRRTSYVDVVAEVMDGFQYVARELFTQHKCVIQKMTPKREGVVAEEAHFLKKHTTRGTKACLPSPYLMGTRMWEPKYSQEAYPTREEFMWALAPVIRQELLALAEVGVDVIQLDEPHLCVFVDEKVRAQFDNPEAEMQSAVDLINAIVQGVDGVTIAVHLCRRNWGRRGWGAEGGYEAILPYIQQLRVEMLMLEFAIPVAGDVAVLSQLSEHFQIGVGCVDCRFPEIEPPETIAERVEKAAEHVSPKRLLLNPDCGFAPGMLSEVPLDEAYAKLKNEVEAAELLRQKYH